MIIRNVCNTDATAIANIYNEYVTGTTVSFELEPVTVKEMSKRIIEISASFPYLYAKTRATSSASAMRTDGKNAKRMKTLSRPRCIYHVRTTGMALADS